MMNMLRSILTGKVLWVAFRLAPRSEKRFVARAIFEYAAAIADEPEMLNRHPDLIAKLKAGPGV